MYLVPIMENQVLIMTINNIKSKIQDWPSIQKTVNQWKREGQQIVFTNGCFDILHYGHIHYLAEAKDLGDKLIIGLNSKNSVARDRKSVV